MADEIINSAAAGQREEQSRLLEYLQIDIESSEEKIKSLKCFTGQEELIPTIYRVSDALHKINEGAYSPSVVAIGPLHRGKKHLQGMEADKVSYMHFLFHRTGNFEQTSYACADAMLKMESIARRCYADDVMRLDQNDKLNCCADQKVRFAQMMLIDGCFMIELFYRQYRNEINPILWNNFKNPFIYQDLIMLENQLPFDVLDKLFRLTIERIPENYDRCPSLTDCVLSFYCNVLSLEASELKRKDDKRTAHVLHLIHSCYLPQEGQGEGVVEEPEPEPNQIEKNFKYSATELDLGGIKFVQGNKNDIFDVKFITTHHSYYCFWRRGHFKIPPFDVNDHTELFLRNLIALEQSCPFMVKSYFTSHAFLMDRLINTAEDVQLLEKKGIIVNSMGSREEVAHLFNNLCKNISMISHYSSKHCLEVIKFHKQRWPKFQVKLRRDYFNNPWTVISVVAAFFLFLLTLLQTIYSIRS